MYWKNELHGNIVRIDQLKRRLPISEKEYDLLTKVINRHPMSISKHYLSLINFDDPDDPIKKMVVPSLYELHRSGSYDTSGEQSNT
jgi:lysine 2,3-aminomutase